ncbi:MAG: hypothetical protein ABSE73_23775, partial [Planctomycetota bacterium]
SFAAAAVEGLAQSRASAGAALALCQFHPKLLQADFLHSRLAVKPPAKLGARALWGAVAGLALFLGAAYMLVDWQRNAAEVAALRQQLDDMKDNIATSKAFVARVNTTRTWSEKRPNYLECLRALTLSFPEEGRIWASSVTLREDMRGILTGHAVDEKSVLDVLDQMKSGHALTDVKVLHMRSAGTKNSQIAFGISFAFQDVGQK